MSKHDSTTKRTQIQLESAKYKRLKQIATRRGVSVAQLVREGVDTILSSERKQDRWEALFSVVGKYGRSGPRENVSQEHDRYLEEIYGDWKSS